MNEGGPRRVATAAKRKGGNGAAAVAEEELDEDLRIGLNEVRLGPPHL